MKFKLIFSIISALFLFTSIASADEIDKKFRHARKYLKENKIAITTSIDEAYTQGAVLVMAEGSPKKGASGGQKRLTAITAAKVVAQRRLAELLEGVAVVSETTVKDSEVVSDNIKTAVTGVIKGAQVVAQDWNEREETALVILKIGMNGPKSFASVMYDKILNEPKIKDELAKPAFTPPPSAPAALDADYDSLVIDATEQNFRPALINRIFNSKGEVIYDPAKISQKILVEQGCGEYTNSVAKAKAALGKRGTKNPLVIKASGTLSASDLQVSDDDAAKIFTINQKSGFMAAAKVAFVLK